MQPHTITSPRRWVRLLWLLPIVLIICTLLFEQPRHLVDEISNKAITGVHEISDKAITAGKSAFGSSPDEQVSPAQPPELTNQDFYTWTTASRFLPLEKHADALFSNRSSLSIEELCSGFPKELLGKIQVVLKLGWGESDERVHGVLAGVLPCIDNALIMSDLDYEIEGRRAYDVLSELSDAYKVDNPEWEIYEQQKRIHENGDDGRASPEGWHLDAYKFLPMIERTYEMRPHADWYVFLESDTYMVWDNVFRFLVHFDPTQPKYMGSVTPNGRDGLPFAYGGCGFVLSHKSVESLAQREVDGEGQFNSTPVSEQNVDFVRGDCCGDSVLGWVLHQHGTNLSGHWPMFNPHGVSVVPYSDLYWCQPVISMHRSSAEEAIQLHAWEEKRRLNDSSPLLYRDLIEFHEYPRTRDDWENGDWDGFRDPDNAASHRSKEACSQACHENPNCFQWNYHELKCTFVKSIRYGYPKEPNGPAQGEDRRYFAGWDLEKIAHWKETHNCPNGPEWVKPSLTRIF